MELYIKKPNRLDFHQVEGYQGCQPGPELRGEPLVKSIKVVKPHNEPVAEYW